jgi:hypothetical protein
VWSTTEWKGREGQVVTILSRDEIGRLLGLRGTALRKRLRELRDEGKLVCSPGRLTAQVRYPDPFAKYGRRIVRQYVLVGHAEDYAVKRRRIPVIMWS